MKLSAEWSASTFRDAQYELHCTDGAAPNPGGPAEHSDILKWSYFHNPSGAAQLYACGGSTVKMEQFKDPVHQPILLHSLRC